MVIAKTSTLFHQVLDPANRANPYPLYAELRRTPVSLEEDGTYVISTYRETAQLLRDPRISSDARNRAEPPQQLRDTHLAVHPTFLSLDPPAHDHDRAVVMRQFGPPHTPGRVEGVRARIAEITTQLIDAQVGFNRIDIVDSFAYRLPVAVISDLLGLPTADGDRLHALSNAVISRIDQKAGAATDEQMPRMEQVNQAEAELADYMSALLAEPDREDNQHLGS